MVSLISINKNLEVENNKNLTKGQDHALLAISYFYLSEALNSRKQHAAIQEKQSGQPAVGSSWHPAGHSTIRYSGPGFRITIFDYIISKTLTVVINGKAEHEHIRCHEEKIIFHMRGHTNVRYRERFSYHFTPIASSDAYSIRGQLESNLLKTDEPAAPQLQSSEESLEALLNSLNLIF